MDGGRPIVLLGKACEQVRSDGSGALTHHAQRSCCDGANCRCCSNGAAAGRPWTVSIAVPGSVIDNTQNVEFATYVAGQIARAAAIFNIDEVRVRDVKFLLPTHPCRVRQWRQSPTSKAS